MECIYSNKEIVTIKYNRRGKLVLNFESVKNILNEYNQQHVLLSYERMNEEEREKLLSQILSIDFEQLKRLYEYSKKSQNVDNVEIEPISYDDINKLSDNEKRIYIEAGENIIKSGKYAVVTVAGGQGTRLGHNGPKGTFDMGLPSHKSLFEIFSDKLREGKEKYGVTIPWYIMTSKENNDETIKFFENNDYFNYKDGVRQFFKQGELPMIDVNGKFIIDKDGFIKEAADGHGGVFDAMIRNNVLEDMKKIGIEWIFICTVDNPLVQMVDPILVGYSAINGYKVTSKSIVKNSPSEKIGVFCMKNGKPAVIEYTEISQDKAFMVDENNELVYGEGHVMLNLFNIDIISELSKEKLPYHVAFKKCNYMNENGEYIEAEEPNAYKFEAFIFDSFERLDNMGILRGDREENFAPIKNAEGIDSPQTARKLYIDWMVKNNKKY